LDKVEVKVFDHKITDLKVIQNRKSAYARFAEGVIPRIMEAQVLAGEFNLALEIAREKLYG